MVCCAWSIMHRSKLWEMTECRVRASALKIIRLVGLISANCPATTTPRFQRLNNRDHGVFQLEEVDRCRPRSVQSVKQGIRAINEEWQGAKDCERAIPATRYPMLVESLQRMLGDCTDRLFQERWGRLLSKYGLILTLHSCAIRTFRHTSRIQELPKRTVSRSRYQCFSEWNGLVRGRDSFPRRDSTADRA